MCKHHVASWCLFYVAAKQLRGGHANRLIPLHLTFFLNSRNTIAFTMRRRAITTLPSVEDEGAIEQLPKQENWLLDLLSLPFSSLFPGFGRLAVGIISAIYVCFLLIIIVAVAVGIAMGVVWLFLERPVFLRQELHFDYTEAQPSGYVSLSSGEPSIKSRPIPFGHSFRVSLVLVLPESEFNIRLGVFQVAAEVISSDGHVLTSSSQPCMLTFKSLPVRTIRTLLTILPHVYKDSSETQKITLEIADHKERNPRTDSIKVTLKPRSGTIRVPQIYSSEVIINSKLPPSKALLYKWKWTVYVWVTICLDMILTVAVLCCFKPLNFSYVAEERGLPLARVKQGVIKRRADGFRRKGKLPEICEVLPAVPAEEGSSSNVGGCTACEVNTEEGVFGGSSESSS
ncbi:putative adipose-regulatory protein (Seipin) [Wolffia australiana]